MVFGDFLNQKVRLAPSLFKVTVDRPVEWITLPIAVPFLLVLGGEDRMFHGENKIAPWR